MRYQNAVCGGVLAHPAHEVGAGACPGWTAAQAETARLIDYLNQLARVLRNEDLPTAHVRLDCHPSVVNALRQMVIPEFGPGWMDEDPAKPSIPVMASTSQMGRGEWRIVLADGKIDV